MEPCITDGSGQLMVFDHPSHIQVLYHDLIVSFRHTGRHLVDLACLWRRTFACRRFTFCLSLLYRLEPFCLRESFFCSLLSFLSLLVRYPGFSYTVPSEVQKVRPLSAVWPPSAAGKDRQFSHYQASGNRGSLQESAFRESQTEKAYNECVESEESINERYTGCLFFRE